MMVADLKGDAVMTVTWGQAVNDQMLPNFYETSGFNQRSQHIYLRVVNGAGTLGLCQSQPAGPWSDGGYSGSVTSGDHKLFDYWHETGSPTEMEIYANYYAGNEAIWQEKLHGYRRALSAEKLDLRQLLVSLYPLLDSLVDGDYSVTIRDMLPTTGDGRYFYDHPKLARVKDAASVTFSLYQGRSSMDTAFPLYLVPTQPEQLTDHNSASRNEPSGLGIAIELNGFNAYLIDGHHKAKAAFAKRQAFPCVVITSLGENRLETLSFQQFDKLPTKLDYGYSIISDSYFLDYPTTEDIMMTYDYFNSVRGLSLNAQTKQLRTILVHGQTQEAMLRLIQGLFYSQNVRDYLKFDQLLRANYPFEPLYRRYYGLLVNWLDKPGVQDSLMQFLVDDFSTDKGVTQFVARQLADHGTF